MPYTRRNNVTRTSVRSLVVSQNGHRSENAQFRAVVDRRLEHENAPTLNLNTGVKHAPEPPQIP